MGNRIDLLKKAVKEYYRDMGNYNGHPVKFIKTLDGYEMLLVRFQAGKGKKMSALMETSEYRNHWDVHEEDVCSREEEDRLVNRFETNTLDDFLGYDGSMDDDDEFLNGPNGTWG